MAKIPTNGGSPPGESGLENGLTPIHRRIHCAATPDTIGDGSELDQLAVDNFLDALAEVALVVARRREEIDR